MARGQTTFHFTLDKHVRLNGERAVYLRVSQDKKSIWFHTSVFVKEQNFNKDSANYKWVRTKDIDNAIKNSALKSFKERIEKTYFDSARDGYVSLDRLKALCSFGGGESLLSFVSSYCDKKMMQKRVGTAVGYRSLIGTLSDFCKTKKRNDINLSDINESFIGEFDLFLHGRGLKESTVSTIEKRLQTILRTAPEGSINGDPFRVLRRKRSPFVSDKGILTEDEVELLEYAILKRESDAKARDILLFCYYANGMRGGDALQLRWGNIVGDDRLSYRMTKTGKMKTIHLVAGAKKIVERYRTDRVRPGTFIFPYLDNDAPWAGKWGSDSEQLPADLLLEKRKAVISKLSIIDHSLRRIMEEVGIGKRITMHSARHSFAMRMLNSGAESAVIKSALGHSSLQMTEKYLRDLDDSKVNAEVQKVFDKDKDMRDLRNALVRLPKDMLAALLSEIEKTQQE